MDDERPVWLTAEYERPEWLTADMAEALFRAIEQGLFDAEVSTGGRPDLVVPDIIQAINRAGLRVVRTDDAV